MQVPYNITLFENITKLRRWVVKDSLTLLQEGGFIKIENDFITLLIEKEEAYEVKTLIPKLLNLYPVQFKLFLSMVLISVQFYDFGFTRWSEFIDKLQKRKDNATAINDETTQ